MWVHYSDGMVVGPSVVAPFAVYCLYQGSEGHAPGWTGGATIQGTEPLAAVVQVLAQDQGSPVGCWAYTAMSATSLGRQAENTLAMPVLFSDANGWTSDVHLYNLGGGPAEITPRYVSLGSRFVYCAESFTLPEGETVSFSQDDLPGFFDQAMAYFDTSQPVAAAVSATSGQPLGDTDRHFGYRVAYVGGEIPFPDTCDEVHRIFVPVIMNQQE